MSPKKRNTESKPESKPESGPESGPEVVQKKRKYTRKVPNTSSNTPSNTSSVFTDGPDINFSLFKIIKGGVYEGIYDGKTAILKRNIDIRYVKYYNKWKDTAALPVVYAIRKNIVIDEDFDIDGTVTIVMEKLVPFEYEESIRESYFKAIEELFNLTKFENMDISPENIMMRAGTNQIVFNDLWTSGWTPVFYTVRKPDIIGSLKKSLARSLFEITHRQLLIAKNKEWTAKTLSIFPTRELMNLFIGCDNIAEKIFYNLKLDESEIHLYTILFVNKTYNKTILVEKWMEDHGKTFSEYVRHGINSSNMPTYDQYCEDVIMTYKVLITDVVKELGATEEEITFFK